tara:strand:+ start:1511 stop:2230 length:720 start_codon:yes stop_codon:yes gene_type:complete
MKLHIDSRENSKLSIAVEKEALGMNIPVEKIWLEIGDYVFDDVCFEAKSSVDFLQSVINKRIWSQIDNMDRAYSNNNVIIYGTIDSAITQYIKNIKVAPKWKPQNIDSLQRKTYYHNKFMGAIGRIILDTDCNVILTSNEKMGAKIICSVFKMKPIDREVYQPRLIKQKKISTTDLRIDVLMTIKGISEAKAALLIQEFGSIMELGESSVSELCKLKGMGETLANRILNTLNSEEKQVM